jgi:hypothetical protein
VADLRKSAIFLCVASIGMVSGSTLSHAEWWKSAGPKDFEDCSAAADQPSIGKDAKTEIIANCDSRFSGRRKPGGGYTYFDFMQNRSFDIAGPNPTQDELKRIDQEYLGYLEDQRKTAILAAFTQQKQPQPSTLSQQPARVSLRQDASQLARPKQPQQHNSLQKVISVPKQDAAPRPPADLVRVRKDKGCSDTLSCGWTKLTMTVQNLRQAFGGPAPKTTTRADQ